MAGRLYTQVDDTLLTVADAVSRVRGEAHIRVLLFGEIVGHILHSNLFRRAEYHPQLPVALHPRVLQGPQAVQGHHGSPLVVRHTPANGSAVLCKD